MSVRTTVVSDGKWKAWLRSFSFPIFWMITVSSWLLLKIWSNSRKEQLETEKCLMLGGRSAWLATSIKNQSRRRNFCKVVDLKEKKDLTWSRSSVSRLRFGGQLQKISTADNWIFLEKVSSTIRVGSHQPDLHAHMLGTKSELHILSSAWGCQECSNILGKGEGVVGWLLLSERASRLRKSCWWRLLPLLDSSLSWRRAPDLSGWLGSDWGNWKSVTMSTTFTITANFTNNLISVSSTSVAFYFFRLNLNQEVWRITVDSIHIVIRQLLPSLIHDKWTIKGA